jgi:hypothetical protein
MMKRRMLMLVFAGLFSGAVLAYTCPAYIDMIDDSLEMADQLGLDDATVDQIKSLRDEGKRHHEAGDHEEAIAALDQALALIEGSQY